MANSYIKGCACEACEIERKRLAVVEQYTTKNPDKFWIVRAENSNLSTVQHQTKSAAQAEATRLSNLVGFQGIKFYVLEVVGYAFQPKTNVPYVNL